MNLLLLFLLLLSTTVLSSPVVTTVVPTSSAQDDVSSPSGPNLHDVSSAVTDNDNNPQIFDTHVSELSSSSVVLSSNEQEDVPSTVTDDENKLQTIDDLFLPNTVDTITNVSDLSPSADGQTSRLTSANEADRDEESGMYGIIYEYFDYSRVSFSERWEAVRSTSTDETLQAAKNELEYLKQFKFFNAHVLLDEGLKSTLPHRLPRGTVNIPIAVHMARKADIMTIGSHFWFNLLAKELGLHPASKLDSEIRELWNTLQDELHIEMRTYSDDWRMDDLITWILHKWKDQDPTAYNARMRSEYSVRQISSIFATMRNDENDEYERMLDIREIIQIARIEIVHERSELSGRQLNKYNNDVRMTELMAELFVIDTDPTQNFVKFQNAIKLARNILTFQLAVDHKTLFAACHLVESAGTDMDPYFLILFRKAKLAKVEEATNEAINEMLRKHRPSLADQFDAIEREEEEKRIAQRLRPFKLSMNSLFSRLFWGTL